MQRRDLGRSATARRMLAEPFREFIEATDPQTLQDFSATDKVPIQHAQALDNVDNVVSIGDANHAMSPFSDNGANMALAGAASLAHKLSRGTDILGAIASFDAESIPNSQNAFSFYVIRKDECYILSIDILER